MEILHDWADAETIAILLRCRTCRAARLEGTGHREPARRQLARPARTHLDVVMLLSTGGRERTEAELAVLLSTAGLRPTRVINTAGTMRIAERCQPDSPRTTQHPMLVTAAREWQSSNRSRPRLPQHLVQLPLTAP